MASILPVGKEVAAAEPLGERLEGCFWEDFSLRFAFTAMQVSVLAGFLCLWAVFDLILFRLQGQGGISEGIFGLFSTMPKQHGPK